MTLAPLSFTRYETTEIGSLSVVFGTEPPERTCGIYILHFEDGHAYVGQARNVVSRYAQHRRTWSDIISLEFASCEATDLDEYERRTLSFVEKSRSVRNLMLAGRPGGWGDLEVTTESGVSIMLPWERERRATAGAAPGSALYRFWELAGHAEYTTIRDLLARYIHETIPDPVLTAHGQWVLVALPSTSQTAHERRLVTLDCGSLETLFIVQETDANNYRRVYVVLNVSKSDAVERLCARMVDRNRSVRMLDRGYGEENVLTIKAEGLHAARMLLSEPILLDAAYRLNVSLMRRGSRAYARHHNEPFALDVLLEVHRLAATSPAQSRRRARIPSRAVKLARRIRKSGSC